MSKINFDTAVEYFVTCRRGDTFKWPFTDVQIDGVNINNTYSATMKVKASENASPILSWETPNEIVITDGAINIVVPANSMDVQSGVYYYDFKVTNPDGEEKTWFYGTFTINGNFS